MATPAERAVKQLARLPENCVCANCGTISKYGFSSVNIKHFTFVCNLCKTAHQAVSHRCKSLTMSSWDQGEVLKLKKHGNNYARKVWLATAPEPGIGGRPKEGDDVNVFKRFVVTVYENRRYYREADELGAGNQAITAQQVKPVAVHVPPKEARVTAIPKKVASSRKARVRAPAPTPMPTPTPDLLDFGAFDSAPAPAQAANTNIHDFADFTQAQPPSSLSDPPFDPFGNNGNQTKTSAPAPKQRGDFSAKAQSSSAPNNLFDPFQNNNSGGGTGAFNSNMNNSGMNNPMMNNMAGGINSGMMQNINGNMMNNNMNMNNNLGGLNLGMMQNINGNMNNVMNTNNNNMGGFNSGMMQNANGTMMNNMMNMNNNNMGGFNSGIMQNDNGNMSMNNSNMAMNSTGTNNMMNMPPQQNLGGCLGTLNGQLNNMTLMSNTGNSNNLTQPMNINVMQPMNNSISNNFTKAPAAVASRKDDPFSGLGF